jgi:hypothetical protein
MKEWFDKLKLGKIVRYILRFSLVVFLLCLLLMAAVNLPSVQTFLVGKVIKGIREKSGTMLGLQAIRVSLPNTVQIDNLYVQDQNKDTLVYLGSLKVKIGLFKLFSNKVSIQSVDIEEAVINVSRNDSTAAFNYQFLLDHIVKSGEEQKPDSTQSSASKWIIELDEIHLRQVHLGWSDQMSGLQAGVHLQELHTSFRAFDLTRQLLSIRRIETKNCTVKVALTHPSIGNQPNILQSTATRPPAQQNAAELGTIGFPDWNIHVDQLLLENSHVRYDQWEIPAMSKGLDFNHLCLTSLNAGLHDLRISREGVSASLDRLDFGEQSGLQINSLQGEFELSEKRLKIFDLLLKTPSSLVSGNTRLDFSCFGELTSNIGNCNLMADWKEVRMGGKDLLLFLPELQTNAYFKMAEQKGILLSVAAEGAINALDINKIELSLLSASRLQAHGKIKGLPDYRKMELDVSLDQLATCREDLSSILNPSLIGSIQLPGVMHLSGHAVGNIDALRADASFSSSFGGLTATILYGRPARKGEDSLELGFTLDKINAGAFLGNGMLGNITASGKVSGSGITSGNLSGRGGIEIQLAQINNYDYTNLTVDSRISNKQVRIVASSKDPGLQFNLRAETDLGGVSKQLSAQLELARMDLQVLNLSDRNLILHTDLSAKMSYLNFNSAEATIDLKNTRLLDAGKPLNLEMIQLHALATPDSLRFRLKSDLAEVDIFGKGDPAKLPAIFQAAWHKYFGIPGTGEEFPGCHLSLQAKIKARNIVQNYFPEIKKLDISDLYGDYNSSNNQLSLHAKIPVIEYGKLHLDSLTLAIVGEKETLSMDLGLLQLRYDSLMISNLALKGSMVEGLIHSHFSVSDSTGRPKYLLANEIKLKPDTFAIGFLPEGLLLDGETWKSVNGNLFRLERGVVSTRQFNFSNQGQSFELIAQGENSKLVFKDFELSNLSNVASYKGKQNILNGVLSGELSMSRAGGVPNFHSDLSVQQFALLDSVMGTIKFAAQSSNERLTLHANIENNQNRMTLSGQIDQYLSAPALDLKTELRINELQHFEKLSLGTLSQMGGKVKGDLSIQGSPDKPLMEGLLDFEHTVFNINSLNLLAKLNKERVLIDSKGFHFNAFEVEDGRGKRLVVDGDLLTNYSDLFQYNLHIVSKDFQPVNSTPADNPIFFGKLEMDNDIWITGDLNRPKIEADVRINSATNLTYVLPGDELKLVSSDGIVKFRDATNRSDTTELAGHAAYLSDSIISKFSALDLKMNLEISPDAKFRLDINPKSGDFLTISGSAKLNISSDVSGNQSVTGIFEAKSGNYQLSFFGLVKKSFAILPGSRIAWSGRPMDAEVDITAGYSVRTSSVALVSNEVSGMSEAEKNVFKQRLPYEVKLHIRGFPNKPEVNFELDLPDSYRAEYPAVASKLDRLNTAELSSELNKQVFALLVTGSFISDGFDAGSAGTASEFASTTARNSVNGILADQLNNISGKYISNVDLNFGLTSYEDYKGGGSDTRTELDVQLSKKLFNDRLTIEAQGSFDLSGDRKNTGSSNERTNGEVGVIYQLTPSNEYKLKVYFKNIYDLFEGELTCSGMALILEKEYETLLRKEQQEKARKKFIQKYFVK